MDEKDTNRLEAFSDGVFAVAITLLILNIKIPPAENTDARLWGQLFLDQGPALFAFVTSFVTIGVMWLNHHRLFKHIDRTDTRLLLLNLLLLLFIVFIPVPTALVAEYLVRPNTHIAAVIYACTCIVMACCFNFLWRYASQHGRLLSKEVDTIAVSAITRQYRFGPLFYLITFVIAWINTPAFVIVNFILALFFALPGRTSRSQKTGAHTHFEEEC